jgi:hypothetical protein
VPDLSGRDLLNEWRKAMEAMVGAASSVGGDALPRQLVKPMERQMELVQELIERERALQRQVAGRLAAPVDAVFDLLAQSGVMLRRQAEALEAAGRALEETSRLVKTQADLFERTISTLREPTEIAKAAAGLDRSKGKRKDSQPARSRRQKGT